MQTRLTKALTIKVEMTGVSERIPLVHTRAARSFSWCDTGSIGWAWQLNWKRN